MAGECLAQIVSMKAAVCNEHVRLQGSVNSRSCPSRTMDSLRTISICVALTVTRVSDVVLSRRLCCWGTGLFALRAHDIAAEEAAIDVMIREGACLTLQNNPFA
jgi:hypothetical protein